MSKKRKLSLFENAIDSLKHSLLSYEMAIDGQDMYFKYTILSLTIYIELSLKYFISKIDPKMIYKQSKPSSKQKHYNMTITMGEAIDILEKQGMYYKSEEFDENLEWLRDINNTAKHHYLEIDISEAKRNVGKIISVLNMLYEENEISIEEELGSFDSRMKEFYIFVIDDYALAEQEAIKNAKKFEPETHHDHSSVDVSDARLDCPGCDCNIETFILDTESGEYSCTYCGYEERAVICECCSKTFPQSERFVDDFNSAIEHYYWCCKECLRASMRSRGCD